MQATGMGRAALIGIWSTGCRKAGHFVQMGLQMSIWVILLKLHSSSMLLERTRPYILRLLGIHSLHIFAYTILDFINRLVALRFPPCPCFLLL